MRVEITGKAADLLTQFVRSIVYVDTVRGWLGLAPLPGGMGQVTLDPIYLGGRLLMKNLNLNKIEV